MSCLEGGYNLDALAESVQAHLEELLSCLMAAATLENCVRQPQEVWV